MGLDLKGKVAAANRQRDGVAGPANRVVFLAPERASCVAGCTIRLDGGFTRGLL